MNQAMQAAGFTIEHRKIEHMWVPVEIVLGVKTSQEIER